MNPLGALLAVAVTAAGLAVSGLGIHLLIVWAKLEVGEVRGWVSAGVLGVGLVGVAAGGSIWRLSGGWMRNRWSRRSRGLFLPGRVGRDEDD